MAAKELRHQFDRSWLFGIAHKLKFIEKIRPVLTGSRTDAARQAPSDSRRHGASNRCR